MSKRLLAADLFCGAGGASTGIIAAANRLGYAHKDLVAVNHWQVAIDTHTANHPEVRHYCDSIASINPRDAFPGHERITLLWASPECTHHSNARGGKPRSDQSRATAWCVLRWVDALTPSVVIIENVPEFETWGPLDAAGNPIKSRKGEIFQAFIAQLRALNYTVEWNVLNAADYGDATTRERIFVIARFGNKRPRWPEPTHRAPGKTTDLFGTLKPWRTAREIIDWTVPGKSIFARKKALAANTLKRILAGFKFCPDGFILGQQSCSKARPFSEPIPTVAAAGAVSLSKPCLICMEHGGRTMSPDKPVPTITTAKGGAMAVSSPMLLELHGGSDSHIAKTARSVSEPVPPVMAGGQHHAVAESFMVDVGGPAGRSRKPKEIDKPLAPVIGQNHTGLAAPFLADVGGPKRRSAFPKSVETPIAPVLCRNNTGVAEPHIIKMFGDGDSAVSVDKPLATVTCGRNRFYQSHPYLVEYYGNGVAQSPDGPLPTQPTKMRFGLATAALDGAEQVHELATCVLPDGRSFVALRHIAEHFAHYVDGVTASAELPANFSLVLVDLLFRMLMPRELALAQGFPAGYVFAGKRQEDIVKQIGNANPCNLTQALTTANLAAL